MSAAAQLSLPTPGEIAALTDQMPVRAATAFGCYVRSTVFFRFSKCVLGLVDA